MAKAVQPPGKYRQAVLVKLHVSGELRQDFVDSLRAVAVEVLEGGYQFYMLLDVGALLSTAPLYPALSPVLVWASAEMLSQLDRAYMSTGRRGVHSTRAPSAVPQGAAPLHQGAQLCWQPPDVP